MSEIRRCIIKGCGGVASKKGLCLRCYSAAKKKVDSGEATWQGLAERGLCESEKNPFDEAYDKATREDEY